MINAKYFRFSFLYIFDFNMIFFPLLHSFPKSISINFHFFSVAIILLHAKLIWKTLSICVWICKITFCREMDFVATFFTAFGNIIFILFDLFVLLLSHGVYCVWKILRLLKYQIFNFMDIAKKENLNVYYYYLLLLRFIVWPKMWKQLCVSMHKLWLYV